MTDVSNYETIRQDAEAYYRKVGGITVPALNEHVHFTSEGFNHLVYKAARTERDRSVQIMKFKLLGKAVELLRIATTFQEYEESIKEFRVKKFKRLMSVSKVVKYWGLIAIMDGWKIKVIVRQIGDGQKHFWSVVPNWITNQHRDLKYVTRMKGNPEED